MSTSLTISGAGISLPDLVIGTNPFGTDMHLPEDGLNRFDFDYFRTYAEGSAYAPRVLLAARLEPVNWPGIVYCHAATTAALRTVEGTLATYVAQWVYDLTLTIDGQAWTVTGEPTLPAFGPVDSGMVAAHISRAALSIPINPQ